MLVNSCADTWDTSWRSLAVCITTIELFKEGLELLVVHNRVSVDAQVFFLQLLSAPHRKLEIMTVVKHLELQNLLQIVTRGQKILTIVVSTETIAIDASMLFQIKLANVEI